MKIDCKVPCKNCPNRKIPKTCENDCEDWKKYKTELIEEKKLIQQTKMLDIAIKKQIYKNNKNKKY